MSLKIFVLKLIQECFVFTEIIEPSRGECLDSHRERIHIVHERFLQIVERLEIIHERINRVDERFDMVQERLYFEFERFHMVHERFNANFKYFRFLSMCR